jgi:hypothetical protein
MENPGQAAAFCLGQGWQVICDLKGNRTLKGSRKAIPDARREGILSNER